MVRKGFRILGWFYGMDWVTEKTPLPRTIQILTLGIVFKVERRRVNRLHTLGAIAFCATSVD